MVLATEEAVLQGMIERLTEIGRCSGMEMNVEEKIKTMGISRQQTTVQITIDHKHPESMEYFNYLGSRKTKDVRCT